MKPPPMDGEAVAFRTHHDDLPIYRSRDVWIGGDHPQVLTVCNPMTVDACDLYYRAALAGWRVFHP